MGEESERNGLSEKLRKWLLPLCIIAVVIASAITDNRDKDSAVINTVSSNDIGEKTFFGTLTDSFIQIADMIDENSSPEEISIEKKEWSTTEFNELRDKVRISKSLYGDNYIQKLMFTYGNREVNVACKLGEILDTFIDLQISKNRNVQPLTQTYGIKVLNGTDVINIIGLSNSSDKQETSDNSYIGSLLSIDGSDIEGISINKIKSGDSLQEVKNKLSIVELANKHLKLLESANENDISTITELYNVCNSADGWYINEVIYSYIDVNTIARIEMKFSGNEDGMTKYSYDFVPFTYDSFERIFDELVGGNNTDEYVGNN